MVEPMWMRVAGAAILAALALACGGDDEGAEPNRYSAALAPRLFAAEGESVDDDVRECVAAEFVDAVGGPEAFESAGVTAEELAEAQDLAALGIDVGTEEARKVAEAFEPCGLSVVELFLSALDLPEDTRRCVEDNVEEEELRRFIVRTIVEADVDVGDAGSVVDPLLVCFEQ